MQENQDFIVYVLKRKLAVCFILYLHLPRLTYKMKDEMNSQKVSLRG